MSTKPETLKEYIENRGGEITADILENTWKESQKENPGVAHRSNGKVDTSGNWD